MLNTKAATLELRQGRVRVSGAEGPALLSFLEECFPQYLRALDAASEVRVVLDSEVLRDGERLQYGSSLLIMNVESAAAAQFSMAHTGKVVWFSKKDPKESLGALLDGFRGSYFDRKRHEVMYCGSEAKEAYSLPLRSEYPLWLTAAVAVARELGVPTQDLQDHILRKFSL